MKKRIFLMWLLAMLMTQPLLAERITLAVDERDWFPFTFQDRETPKGMHIELVTHALRELGYEVKILPFPRKRCIYNTKIGKVDGMLSVVFHPSLQLSMLFPKDAANRKESAWRIMQVDHVLVTPKKGFDYSGDLTALPSPVRIPRGEPLTLDLIKAGLTVDEGRSDLVNFRKMVRDMDGSVVTTSIIAETINEDPEFKNKLKIHATPISSQSYFLAFSRKSPISDKERQRIWDEIRKWRNDYVFMLQVFAKY